MSVNFGRKGEKKGKKKKKKGGEGRRRAEFSELPWRSTLYRISRGGGKEKGGKKRQGDDRVVEFFATRLERERGEKKERKEEKG